MAKPRTAITARVYGRPARCQTCQPDAYSKGLAQRVVLQGHQRWRLLQQTQRFAHLTVTGLAEAAAAFEQGSSLRAAMRGNHESRESILNYHVVGPIFNLKPVATSQTQFVRPDSSDPVLGAFAVWPMRRTTCPKPPPSRRKKSGPTPNGQSPTAASECCTRSTTQSVQRIPQRALQPTALHAVIGLVVSDQRLDGLTPFEPLALQRRQ